MPSEVILFSEQILLFPLPGFAGSPIIYQRWAVWSFLYQMYEHHIHDNWKQAGTKGIRLFFQHHFHFRFDIFTSSFCTLENAHCILWQRKDELCTGTRPIFRAILIFPVGRNFSTRPISSERCQVKETGYGIGTAAPIRFHSQKIFQISQWKFNAAVRLRICHWHSSLQLRADELFHQFCRQQVGCSESFFRLQGKIQTCWSLTR